MAKSKLTNRNAAPKTDVIKKIHKGKVNKNTLKKQRQKKNVQDRLHKNLSVQRNDGAHLPLKTTHVETVSTVAGSSNKSKKKLPVPQKKNFSSGVQDVSKNNTAFSALSGTETQFHGKEKSKQIQIPPKSTHSKTSGCPDTVVTKTNGSSSTLVDNNPAGKRKKKKVSKKAHDGVSNWASLCSVLKIDPTRKSKPPKPQEETKDTNIQEVSEHKRSKPEIWFDNVDKILIEGDFADGTPSPSGDKEDGMDKKLVKPDSFKGVTHCVSMDCEMVGVGPGGDESILARVSIVNHYGVCLYDKFVLPREKVTDYRTHVSGVTKENLSTGEEFTKVQREVSDIIKGKVLVGHALHNDLRVLFLTHPHKMVRDTSKYKPFRQLLKGGIPSLKKLADRILGVSVQEGEHSSIQDAQAAMRLYTMHRQRWEKELKQIWKHDKKKTKKKIKKKGKQGES